MNSLAIHTQPPTERTAKNTEALHVSTVGAQREGRTPTLLREPDFESGASASSAIRAQHVPT